MALLARPGGSLDAGLHILAPERSESSADEEIAIATWFELIRPADHRPLAVGREPTRHALLRLAFPAGWTECVAENCKRLKLEVLVQEQFLLCEVAHVQSLQGGL